MTVHQPPDRSKAGTEDRQPLLVICRQLEGAAGLNKLRTHRPITVASDDLRVQLAASRIPGVGQVCFIEGTASFYSVSTAVRTAVETIDEWLAGFAPHCPEISPEVLRWGCTVEGGMTSQRVQDLLLLIDSYHNLLDQIQPAEITLISSIASQWEDYVLMQVAKLHAIPLCRQAPIRLHQLVRSTINRLCPRALAAYRLIHLFRRGGGRLTPRSTTLADAQGSIVFTLCSGASNHFENIKPVLLELARQGSPALILRWLANERMAKRGTPNPSKLGMTPCYQLEHWVGLRDIWIAYRHSVLLRREIMPVSQEDSPWTRLAYRGVPLAPLLNESLRHFLVAELPGRITFLRALRSVFGDAVPAAVKPWGAPEGFEYRVISRLWPESKRPLVFQYWLGVGMAWPYADPRQHLDLFLAKTMAESAQVARDYCREPQQIELVGQIRLAGHRQFADATPQDDSRRRLRLPEVADALYVGFDPNCALRGYQSSQEQTEITQALLVAASQTRKLVLVVKPHPAYPIDHLVPLFEAAHNPNVVLLPPGAALNHFLNSVDVMVSKYSTLLLEAALMRRFSAAVIFDGDMRFRVFGDLALVISDPAALTQLLLQLAEDLSERFAWSRKRLQKQEEYLQQHIFFQLGIEPAVRAAASIVTHAERHLLRSRVK